MLFLKDILDELEMGDAERLATSSINQFEGVEKGEPLEKGWNRLLGLIQRISRSSLQGLNGQLVSIIRRFAQQNPYVMYSFAQNYGKMWFLVDGHRVIGWQEGFQHSWLYSFALFDHVLFRWKKAFGVEVECVAISKYGHLSAQNQKDGEGEKERLNPPKKEPATTVNDIVVVKRRPHNQEVSRPHAAQSGGIGNGNFHKRQRGVPTEVSDGPKKVRQVIGIPDSSGVKGSNDDDYYGPPPQFAGSSSGSGSSSTATNSAGSTASKPIMINGVMYFPASTKNSEVCLVHFDTHNQGETLISDSLMRFMNNVERCSYSIRGFANNSEEIHCFYRGSLI